MFPVASKDSLGVTGSALLELRFGEASNSVLCSMATAVSGTVRPLEDFRAAFIVAIRDAGDATCEFVVFSMFDIKNKHKK